MQLDDKRLVELAKAGNLDAFGQLYERYSPGVFNLVLRMLGSNDDAEDMKQEVFLRAHKSLGTFKGEAKFSTWIYRIATNICLDELRRKKPVASTDALLEQSSWEPVDQTWAGDPDRRLDQKITQEAVQSALMQMGEHYRVLIVLRHLEDLSYEEIAAIAGCSVNSLNVRLHRAREAFRKALTQYLRTEESQIDLPSGPKENIALL